MSGACVGYREGVVILIDVIHAWSPAVSACCFSQASECGLEWIATWTHNQLLIISEAAQLSALQSSYKRDVARKDKPTGRFADQWQSLVRCPHWWMHPRVLRIMAVLVVSVIQWRIFPCWTLDSSRGTCCWQYPPFLFSIALRFLDVIPWFESSRGSSVVLYWIPSRYAFCLEGYACHSDAPWSGLQRQFQDSLVDEDCQMRAWSIFLRFRVFLWSLGWWNTHHRSLLRGPLKTLGWWSGIQKSTWSLPLSISGKYWLCVVLWFLLTSSRCFEVSVQS